MKALYLALPLALLAACSGTSRIANTDETVSFRGTSYDVYLETIRRNETVYGHDVIEQRKLVYVKSRYLICGSSCDGAVAGYLGN